MEKIKVIDEKKCNEILNKYKVSYYYDYDNDCFIDDDKDINPPEDAKTITNKENLFKKARDSGVNEKIKKLNEIKNNGKMPIKKTIQKLKAAYKKAYDNVILKPYETLTDTNHKEDAYNLAKELDVKVCPYCNINYIYVVEVNKTDQLISRPDFDHFFSKSMHPEFQLKLFNLVPSCQVCNRTIKRDKEFDEKKNLNPYKLSFDTIKYFDIKFKSDKKYNMDEDCILSILGSKISEDCFDIIFRSRQYASKEDKRKANGNIKDFRLYERYQNHKDIVVDLFKKQKAYYDARINEISSISGKNYNQLYAALFSDYDCVINHTSLGKLKKDIINKYIKQ